MKSRPDDYVVFIVPERHHRVRRMHVSGRTLKQITVTGVTALCLLTFSVVHYACTIADARRAPKLLAENVALSLKLTGLQADIERLERNLKDIDRAASRVRAITKLNDPARNLSMGPLNREPATKAAKVLYAQDERIDSEDEIMDSKLAARLVEEGLDAVRDHATQTRDQTAELDAYLEEHSALLSTTPSVRPVASKLISGHFGKRRDPFTGRDVMHKGIDFLADPGADVFAPADGRVIFTGIRGAGYGETLVLDHGFGVQTLFAHLKAARVGQGELVRRGQIVAAVGQSGRTTGAHLHYEVRFNGLPYDPEHFILDD